MSRRTTILLPGGRDGTSQRGRRLPALDPATAPIDERGTADLLAFVRGYAGQLRYFAARGDEVRDAGAWTGFADHPELTLTDVVAHIADPGRFADEHARWLGRPHFALLLGFLELMGHARDQLNGLTRRHLDYYYRDVLHMTPGAATPDRVHVRVHLGARVDELLLPAGTAMEAGRDGAGAPQVYRSERDLLVSRAEVAALRSVYVHRRITGIPDVRKNRDLSAREAFERSLALALGHPLPGDTIPPWRGAPVDLDAVLALRPAIEFAPTRLYLAHHELRKLMQLVRRRAAADHEWAEINRLLGLVDPAEPRNFTANLTAVVGVLDFDKDGLPQVASVDDLYEHRDEPDVRAYIDARLVKLGYANFSALMPIKRRIDAEWAEINRMLAQVGNRQRGMLAWTLAPKDPAAFTSNLATALGSSWPPPWPWGGASIEDHDAGLRALEAHFSMQVERLGRVVDFVDHVEQRGEQEWGELDRLLADAHREKIFAGRRAALAATRGAKSDLTGFDLEVRAALASTDPTLEWPAAREQLAQLLDRGQIDLLDHFRRQFSEPAVAHLFSWADVDRALELAQRTREGLAEPVARKVEWRNLYAYPDATALQPDPASPRWKTFGERPRRADADRPPHATLGFALCSPQLALGQGARKLTLTFGLRPFDLAIFVRALGLVPGGFDEAGLVKALAAVVKIEVTSADAWIELPLVGAGMFGGKPKDDYWTALAVPRALDEDRAALQLRLAIGVTQPALAPLITGGETWPTLRITLRQRWDGDAEEWVTTMTPFEPLVLAAVHLAVDVDGLVDVRVQHEDRAIDPRAPFEPFGNRPMIGARTYISHPELTRARLDLLRLDIEWMGLPASLKAQYRFYPGLTSATVFKARLALIDRGLELPLADAALFTEGEAPASLTGRAQSLKVDSVDAAIHAMNPGYDYARRGDDGRVADLRATPRHLRLELTPYDFGHAIYPTVAAAKARELSVGLAKGTVTVEQAGDYSVEPPYTPKIKRLSVAYRAAIELDPNAEQVGADRLLHVHPFGVSRIDPGDTHLFPRYDAAGELYIGLQGLDAPRPLSLLMQLAEGTSDPELARAPVEWSALDGDRWLPLAGEVRHDSTRGLINSGIVELALPAAAPAAAAGGRLPGDLYWLRVAIARDPGSVCDAVGIHANAVTLRFDDRGAAPEHYDQPLAVGSVTRLADPDARIAAISQPYTSFGGHPPEAPGAFDTRVSERLRHKQRALSPWDYERLVLQRFGQIYKAKCLSAGAARTSGGEVHREPGRVEVVVIPDIRDMLPADAFAPRAPANLLADIEAYLGERAPPAARVVVRNPQYVAVAVRLGVRFKAGVDERFATRRLGEDLGRFLSPWAYDEGAELMIGGRIYASSILDFVDRRDYVEYVAELKLARSDDGENFTIVPPTPEDYHVAADRPDQVLVAAREHHIDVISELEYQQALFTGINYMKLGLDFIVS